MSRRRATVAAVLGLCTGGCADRLVLYPSTRPLANVMAERRMLPFAGGDLEIFVARSPGCARAEPAAFDLELTGNGGRADHVAGGAAHRWGDRPVEVWAVNYPGYGRSTGPATLPMLVPSAVAAYDAMTRAAPGRPVLLGCHSLGTAVGLRLAVERPVAGLVLLNPPPLRRLIVGRYGWWNLWLGASVVALQIPRELDSPANAARLAGTPAVFASGGLDTVVPPPYQRQVYGPYAGPKRLVTFPDAGHNDVPDPADAAEYGRALDWLWDQAVLRQ